MSAPTPTTGLHLRVEGRVQGVGFRDACVRRARQLGLTGWVRNRRDGSVEVMAHGRMQAIAALQAWLHRGPAPARVDCVTPIDEALGDADNEAAPGFTCRDTV